MNDHQSFLKFIGLSPRSEEESVSKTGSVAVSAPCHSESAGADEESRDSIRFAQDNTVQGDIPLESSAVQSDTELMDVESLPETVEATEPLPLEEDQSLTENQNNGEAEPSRTIRFDYEKSQQHFRLLGLGGIAQGNAFILESFPCRIGRDPSLEIVLDDPNVSRVHVTLENRNGHIVLVDHHSTNGAKVNGTATQEHILQNHDCIQMGDALFEFLLPGEESQGFSHAKVLENTTDATLFKRKKWKKKMLVPVFFISGAILFYFLGQKNFLKQTAREKSLALLEYQVETIRSSVQNALQKPLEEVGDEELRKTLREQIEKSSFASLLPSNAVALMDRIPGPALKVFLGDSALLSDILREGASVEALQKALHSRVQAYVSGGKISEALALVNVLVSLSPEDHTLRELRKKLREMSGAPEDNPNEISESELKEFNKYMENFENIITSLLNYNDFQGAIAFSKKVQAGLTELVRQEPKFESHVQKPLIYWTEKEKSVQKDRKEFDEKMRKELVREQEGDKLFEAIKLHLDIAEPGEATLLMDTFLKKYAQHPRVEEVKELKQEVEKSIEAAYRATEAKVRRFLEIQSYENAWRELYNFLDKIPGSLESKKLKIVLEAQTVPKATQYYNQGRVYEYETDDLIAAEQYYKKALEVADPRGQLFEKASRRYQEVHRKISK